MLPAVANTIIITRWTRNRIQTHRATRPVPSPSPTPPTPSPTAPTAATAG